MPIRFVPKQPVSRTARGHIRKADLRRDLEEVMFILDGGRDTVGSVANLRSIDTSGYVEGSAPVIVDGVGLFQWDPSSSAPDDGAYTLKPNGVTGAGRWVRPSPAPLTGVGNPGSHLFALADHNHEIGSITGILVPVAGPLPEMALASLRVIDTSSFRTNPAPCSDDSIWFDDVPSVIRRRRIGVPLIGPNPRDNNRISPFILLVPTYVSGGGAQTYSASRSSTSLTLGTAPITKVSDIISLMAVNVSGSSTSIRGSLTWRESL